MGNNVTVTDSGPVIHLSEIGFINCFNNFKPVIVPRPIYDEIKKRSLPGNEEIGAELFQVIEIPNNKYRLVDDISKKYNLGVNDSSVIVLAKLIHADIIFTDDLELRDIVKKFGIIPVGTVGILVRSFREGSIDSNDLDNALDDLITDSSLYITKDLIYNVKEAVKKH